VGTALRRGDFAQIMVVIRLGSQERNGMMILVGTPTVLGVSRNRDLYDADADVFCCVSCADWQRKSGKNLISSLEGWQGPAGSPACGSLFGGMAPAAFHKQVFVERLGSEANGPWRG
jgi:hypothetical protein